MSNITINKPETATNDTAQLTQTPRDACFVTSFFIVTPIMLLRTCLTLKTDSFSLSLTLLVHNQLIRFAKRDTKMINYQLVLPDVLPVQSIHIITQLLVCYCRPATLEQSTCRRPVCPITHNISS